MTDKPAQLGLWYFAHPYTVLRADGSRNRLAEGANAVLANYRAGELLKAGYAVFSPISHSHGIDHTRPEFLADDEGGQLPWYEIDNLIIDRTRWDGIILAPGWENSVGCVAEVAVFRSKDLPVLLYEVALATARRAE